MKKIIFLLFIFFSIVSFLFDMYYLQNLIKVIENWVIEKNYSNNFLSYYEFFHINNKDTNSGNFSTTNNEYI